jgi:hypothetical protein
VEFDDRPGPVRDALASSVKTWLSAMRRAVVIAVQEGHLSPDTDADQMAFEIHALILALHYEVRFLRQPDSLNRAHKAFDGIVARFGGMRETPAAPIVPQRARASSDRAPH